MENSNCIPPTCHILAELTPPLFPFIACFTHRSIDLDLDFFIFRAACPIEKVNLWVHSEYFNSAKSPEKAYIKWIHRDTMQFVDDGPQLSHSEAGLEVQVQLQAPGIGALRHVRPDYTHVHRCRGRLPVSVSKSSRVIGSACTPYG